MVVCSTPKSTAREHKVYFNEPLLLANERLPVQLIFSMHRPCTRKECGDDRSVDY
jgi:hypothetical protein